MVLHPNPSGRRKVTRRRTLFKSHSTGGERDRVVMKPNGEQNRNVALQATALYFCVTGLILLTLDWVHFLRAGTFEVASELSLQAAPFLAVIGVFAAVVSLITADSRREHLWSVLLLVGFGLLMVISVMLNAWE